MFIPWSEASLGELEELSRGSKLWTFKELRLRPLKTLSSPNNPKKVKKKFVNV
jgi:hypothetical protein